MKNFENALVAFIHVLYILVATYTYYVPSLQLLRSVDVEIKEEEKESLELVGWLAWPYVCMRMQTYFVQCVRVDRVLKYRWLL